MSKQKITKNFELLFAGKIFHHIAARTSKIPWDNITDTLWGDSILGSFKNSVDNCVKNKAKTYIF